MSPPDDCAGTTPAEDDRYTARQRQLAAGFAARLQTACVGAAEVLGSHGLATALISVGVQTARVEMTTTQVADWLREIADRLEVAEDGEAAGGGTERAH